MVQTRANSRTRLAVLAIVTSVGALSLGDALIKGVGVSLPLWQMFVLRSALTLPLLWLLARRHGPVMPAAPGWAVARSVLLVLMWLSYYASLALMPLSLAAAVYYAGPLFIVIFAAALSRVWPPARALVAIACGFAGVLLIIRPDPSGLSAGTLLPLLAAVLYAAAMVLTAAKCRDDNPFILAFLLNAAFVLAGAGLGLAAGRDGSLVLGHWQAIDTSLALTIAALAGLLLIGSVCAAYAYQNGPPATVAAFDYAYLVFSLIWGGLFFAELPDTLVLLGIAVIAGAGLLALPWPDRSPKETSRSQ
ncbi:MAG: DMT family transporter [Pseudomonadota bacterium]